MSSEDMSRTGGLQQQKAKSYPMILERIVLLAGFVAFFIIYPEVIDYFSNQILGNIAAFCLLPIALLIICELIGRFIQSLYSN